VCEDAGVIFARRIVIALLLAAFRIWRRLPPEERTRVLNTVRKQVPRAAASIRQRAKART
jgi:acyl-CoA reductase-like NAD-dependent aldehyde dehydrogenase